MLKKLKQIWNIEKFRPVLLGLGTGIYPFLFYVSNNFYGTNSLVHWGTYLSITLGGSILFFYTLFYAIKRFEFLKKYEKNILFVAIIGVTAFFMSYATTLLIKKKMLVGILTVSALLSIKLSHQYKKLLVFLVLLSILPSIKLAYKGYNYLKPKTWLQLPDDIESVEFKNTPNVYMLQPDGYTSNPMMESPIYGYKTDMYNWLDENGFTLYNDFRSNYSTSLASNASLFSMKHHYFASEFLPEDEIPYAREIIFGNNPVISIFKKNGYTTHFIAETDYFIRNRPPQLYDHVNLKIDEIPIFPNREWKPVNIEKDFEDMLAINGDKPKFYFIEKLSPHHVSLYIKENRIEEERKEYLRGVEEANIWIKKTITAIEKKDPNALIIVMADHGGWVGIFDDFEMQNTREKEKILSIFSNLMAVKWNGNLPKGFDRELKSNVNVFRILFASLSENEALLEALEDDSSYNVYNKNSFFKGVVEVINDEGEVIYKKL